MADKIVVMHDGLVEQIGAPLELYDRPDNLFVAGFIGSPAMNFLHGRVDRRRRRRASCAGDGIALPLGQPLAATRRPAGRLGLRPEHLHLGGEVPLAEVVVVEPTGSEMQVIGRRGGEEIVGVFRERISARPGRDDPRLDDPIATHLFDGPSGAHRRLRRPAD